MKETHIGIRLKEFREKTKIKMPAIAIETGISKETLYKWEKGTRPGNVEEYIELKLYLDKMDNKMEQNDFLIESRKPATLRLPLNPDRIAIPQIYCKEAAGTVIITDDEAELIVDRINAPCLGQIEGVVEVRSDNMEPTFRHGSKIGIMRLKDQRLLDWGDCYCIIDKNLLCSVKRIYPGNSENNVLLISDNPDQEKYPPVTRRWDQIEAILRILVIFQKY